MKKIYLLSLAAICVIAVSSIIFTKALCEEDEPGFEALCSSNDYFQYDKLLASALCQIGPLYEQRNDTLSLEPIISYLERKEKSPPA